MFLANLGSAALWDNDETLYTTIAREMSVRGDWIVPTFNASLFPEKPPLMFWLMMGSFKLLGVNELAARLPAAILAIGTALATYHLARRLFSANVGFWAGLVVSSNIIFTVSARAATVDSALTFLTTLVMLVFAKGAKFGEDCRVGQDPGRPRAGRRRRPTIESVRWAIVRRLARRTLRLRVSAQFVADIRRHRGAPWTGHLGQGADRLPAACRVAGSFPAGNESSIGGRRARRSILPAARSLNQLAATFSPRQMLRVTWSMRPITVLAVAAIVASLGSRRLR